MIGILKLAIIGTTLVLSWRSRHARGHLVFVAVAQVWTVFMVFAPGAAAQYLVWPAPFLLMAGARRYAWVTAACTAHLVIFYTVLSGGFPWYFGIARAATNPLWMLSGNIAWLAFVFCITTIAKTAPVPSPADAEGGRLSRLLPQPEAV